MQLNFLSFLICDFSWLNLIVIQTRENRYYFMRYANQFSCILSIILFQFLLSKKNKCVNYDPKIRINCC